MTLHWTRRGGWCAFSAKPGVLRNGCVVFKTCITDARRPLGDGGYAGQVDALWSVLPTIEASVSGSIEAVPSPFLGHLRVAPTLNGQTRNIRWARDYELVIPAMGLVDLSVNLTAAALQDEQEHRCGQEEAHGGVEDAVGALGAQEAVQDGADG